MPELYIDDMQDGYRDWVEYVRAYGMPRSPRGLPTVNVRDLTVILTDPRQNLTHHIGRNASTRLAALEALQLVAGRSYHDIMVKVAPNTAQFTNVYGKFLGAYGDRVVNAVPLVVERLLMDKDTRQAVVTIFDTEKDLGVVGNRDVACTVSLFYELEDGRLNTKTMMRSNDVMWGVAHDVFMFTTLQRTIAEFLGVEVGEYRHTAYSSHFYLRDCDAADEMHAPTKPITVVPPLWHADWGICDDPAAAQDSWRLGPQAHARLNIEQPGRQPSELVDWWTHKGYSWQPE